MADYPKIALDIPGYVESVRTAADEGTCFICSIVPASEAAPTERLYLLSLGSHQGNAHVHWHIAPLPPGVPYAKRSREGSARSSPDARDREKNCQCAVATIRSTTA